ncbi:Uncharacterised protein [Mycobacteroides abscessus subsp. abscessus]|nr:Uncharacterised protein [Mycobacteroides abscessus subsp. abscessus]
MPPSSPRRDWHSSMIEPMNSLGAITVVLTTGSNTDRILPSGQMDGLVTIIPGSSAVIPSVITRYTTLGAVEMRSRLNSRSRRSRVISMCSNPRKPQRNPKPSATEVSGS